MTIAVKLLSDLVLGCRRVFDLTILFQPYVYNQTSEVMISFDNAQSFSAKGNYIKKTGLKGFSMWEAGGDYYDLLLDSLRCAAGFDNQYTYKRNWNWNS